MRTDASDPFHLAPVLQGETLLNVDVALDRQGQKFDLILNADPLPGGRQIFGCVVTLANITERKQAEEAPRESDACLRQLFNSDLIDIIFADMERIFDENNAFPRIVGYTQEDLKTGAIAWPLMTPPECINSRPGFERPGCNPLPLRGHRIDSHF